MTQAVNNYAQTLLELGVTGKEADEAEQIFKGTPLLLEILENPLISQREKERVIDRVFRGTVSRFLKVACRHGRAGEIPAVLEGLKELLRQRQGALRARLSYVTPPGTEVEENMKAFLRRKYGKREVDLILTQDPSLIGGFLLQAEGREYDYSLRGRYMRLSQALIRR